MKYLGTDSKNELIDSILSDLGNDAYMKILHAIMIGVSLEFIPPSVRRILVDMVSEVPDDYTISSRNIDDMILIKEMFIKSMRHLNQEEKLKIKESAEMTLKVKPII